MKKIFRHSIYLFSSLLAINFFIALIVSILNTNITEMNSLNTFYNNSRISLNYEDVTKVDKISAEMKLIMKQDNININFNTSGDTELLGGKSEGVYSKKDFKVNFNILSGRMFTKEDLDSKERLAVIGKDFIPYTFIESGTTFIKRAGEKYRVIGSIGKNDVKTMYDDILLYNLNSIIDNAKRFPGVFSFTSNYYSDTALLSLISKKIDGDNNTNVAALMSIGEVYENPALSSFFINISTIATCFVLIISLTITLIVALLQWLEALKPEIYIRVLSGSTKKALRCLLLKRIMILSCISLLLTNSLLIFLRKNEYLKELIIEFNYLNVIITTLITIVILIILLLFINKNLKSFSVKLRRL